MLIQQTTNWWFFLNFPQNRIWFFIQTVSIWDNLPEMPKSCFLGKIKKLISTCRLLKILPKVLSIKGTALQRKAISRKLIYYFSIKTYVVGTHYKHLKEMLLMSTHNICFYGGIRKNINMFLFKKFLINMYTVRELQICWTFRKICFLLLLEIIHYRMLRNLTEIVSMSLINDCEPKTWF